MNLLPFTHARIYVNQYTFVDILPRQSLRVKFKYTPEPHAHPHTPVGASSIAANLVARINAEVGLPKDGPRGALCPMDTQHRDAKFLKILSVKDTKLISERERSELMEALKLAHSSGDLEVVPHIESWCVRVYAVFMCVYVCTLV